MADNADLGQKIETFVDELVNSGRYPSRTDVLREGVLLVEEREKRRLALDEALREGIADADAGRVTPLEDVAARLHAKYSAMIRDREQ